MIISLTMLIVIVDTMYQSLLIGERKTGQPLFNYDRETRYKVLTAMTEQLNKEGIVIKVEKVSDEKSPVNPAGTPQ